MIMKKLFYIILLCLISSFAFAQEPAPGSPKSVTGPQFFVNISGGDTTIYLYKGSVLGWTRLAKKSETNLIVDRTIKGLGTIGSKMGVDMDSTATSMNNFLLARNANGDIVQINANFGTSNNTIIFNAIKINANGGLQTNATTKGLTQRTYFLAQDSATGNVYKDTSRYGSGNVNIGNTNLSITPSIGTRLFNTNGNTLLMQNGPTGSGDITNTGLELIPTGVSILQGKSSTNNIANLTLSGGGRSVKLSVLDSTAATTSYIQYLSIGTSATKGWTLDDPAFLKGMGYARSMTNGFSTFGLRYVPDVGFGDTRWAPISGGAYVPPTRNLTINGVSQTLAADRTYTITTANTDTTVTGFATNAKLQTYITKANAPVKQGYFINQTLHTLTLINYTDNTETTIQSQIDVPPGGVVNTAFLAPANNALIINNGSGFFDDIYTSADYGVTFTSFIANNNQFTGSTIGGLSANNWFLITEHGVSLVTPNISQNYQPILASGTNIKTINSATLLGSGNIVLQTPLVSGTDYEVPLTFTSGLIRSANTIKSDTTILQTVLNFFPKGDTRYAKSSSIITYTASNGVVKTINNFASDTTYNRTVLNSASLAQLQTKFNGETLQIVATRGNSFTGQILAQSFGVSGTGGNGYNDIISQSISPTSTSGHLKIYSDSVNRFSWKNSNYRRTIQVPYPSDYTIRMPYLVIGTTLEDSTHAATHYAPISIVGTVTNVSSANSDISVSVSSPNPVLTLNSGSGANQIAKRDGSGNFNATTATTLATPRNIQGIAFNGSANINPINGTGFVKTTGTTLSYDNSRLHADTSVYIGNFFGTSITAGFGLTNYQTRWSFLFSTNLGLFENNFGQPSSTLSQSGTTYAAYSMSRRIGQIPVYNSKTSGLLVFEYGTNEESGDTATYRKVYDTVLTAATVTKGWPANKILLPSPTIKKGVSSATILLYVTRLYLEAQKFGTNYYDLYHLALNHGGFSNLQSDSTHFNVTGSKLVSDSLTAYMTALYPTRYSTFYPGQVYAGYNTSAASTTATGNVAVSSNALASNTIGQGNINIGINNGTGGTVVSLVSSVGTGSLPFNTSPYVAALGSYVFYSNTTGTNLAGGGYQAGFFNTTGSNNTHFGYQAAFSNSTGSNITSLGYQANYANSTGNNNVAFGAQALSQVLTTSNNVAIGTSAGINGSTPLQNISNSTFIGNGANSSIDAITNSTAIGATAQVTASNQMMFGNTGVTSNVFHGKILSTTFTANSLIGFDASGNLTAFTGSYYDATNSRLELGASIAPTKTLTLASVSTGLQIHNQVDQVTNTEDLRLFYTSNRAYLLTEIGGTGTNQGLSILSGGTGGVGVTYDQSGSILGFTSKISETTGSTGSSGGAGLISHVGTLTASSVVQSFFGITPTVTQTSTGGYQALYISPFENSVGSGTKYLINAGTNSAANGSGTHTPHFTVDDAGSMVLWYDATHKITFTTSSSGALSISNTAQNTIIGGNIFVGNIFDNVTNHSAYIDLLASGVVLLHNTNDANPAATSNNLQGTGDIHDFDFNSVKLASINSTGFGNFTGGVSVNGSSSGIISIIPQAVAGTYNFNLPTTAGSAGQPVLSGGGSSNPMTYGPTASIIGTPTIVAGAGAGTGPTVSVTSNGKQLQVTVTTGTLPTGTNATVATITLANALSYIPYPTFTAATANSSLLTGASMIYMTSSGTANVTITSGTTALTAATTYVWNITL